MNYLLDPTIRTDTPIIRRGLVIGDVQSGKTSTYIGLICKAADAGFRVFILLTGTTESLRRQTQERVEEGFIGIDLSDKQNMKRVGVGCDNKDIYATSLTSRASDFTGNSSNIAMALNNRDAVVFVIKKQKDVLDKLTKWLTSINVDPLTKKINLPMLMIDDEADNASINTGKSREDPTTINKLIRKLANVFMLSTYVGFTATPFANVFIDPETTEEMENQDLFPENFIVSLPTPSDYIGAEKIFAHNGEHHSQLVYIKDAGIEENDGCSFYFKHKKEWEGELPASLTDAVYAFYIVNAIRDLRGNKRTHRSMLVNMSRFVKVQKYISKEIEEIHAEACREIKFNISHNLDKVLENPVLKKIHAVWENYFADTEKIYSWDNIVDTLYQSIEDIVIKVVNSSKGSDKLIYPENESVRVIAIGGLALSRGLTLEGLIISYFYRNTCTYDVLMQMGRWFGYRRGYEDLFRIWINKASADWYAEISEATELLKSDMQDMNDLKLSPRDFGIRVKSDADDLQITAYNKMRNSKPETLRISFFGSIFETPYLVFDTDLLKKNFALTKAFIESFARDGKSLERQNTSRGTGRYMITDVPKERIVSYLNSLSLSPDNSQFKVQQINSFLLSCSDPSIDLFDIAFVEGNGDEDRAVEISSRKIRTIVRGNCSVSDNRLNIGQRGKLGGPNDGLAGIVDGSSMSAEEKIEHAKKCFREYYESVKHKKFSSTTSYPVSTWFRYIKERKPLLIIYLITVEGNGENENQKATFDKFRKEMNGIPCVGLAIGFPENDAESLNEAYQFRANKVYNWFERDRMISEAEEE